MFPDGNRRHRRARMTAVITAIAALAAGCGGQPADPPVMPWQPPPAHPHCGAPVQALGAPQLQRAYGVPAMLAAGISGTGTTIAVIVPYANPWVRHDLAVYSFRYHLPAARLRVIRYGHVLSAAAGGATGRHWAREGTEDLEMAHALAPGAALAYIEVTDNPLVMYDRALSWTVAHVRPDVVSYSSGTPESGGLPGAQAGLEAAARAGVSVVAAAGDTGATAPASYTTLLRSRAVLWPASDPLATAVGGTWLHVDAVGRRVRPDTAWSNAGGSTAGGAGHSAFFPRPAWQDSIRAVAGGHRAIADVSMDGSECSPGVIYQQAQPPAGWDTTQGTSMSTPLLAALIAAAAQAAGHRLGLLGPALYTLHGTADGLLDVTQGNDSIPGMPGWAARPGYDLPTGIGTVAAALPFVTALVRAAS